MTDFIARLRSKSQMLLVALCFGAMAATSPDLREYVNEQFGFIFRYPGELVPGATRSDGSGQEFHTPNGEFKVFAFAVPAGGNPRQVIVRSFAEELKMFGDAVSYKRKGDTWFVVSGVNKAGLEFYSKAYANSSAMTLLRITYPHSQNSIYDFRSQGSLFAPLAFDLCSVRLRARENLRSLSGEK